MEFSLREPEPGDIGWLISSHAYQYAKQYDFGTDFELDIARKVISFFESDNSFNRMHIAYVDNKRVGSIAVSLKFDNSAFINFLLVEEHHRGHGIGRKLIEKVISQTVEHGLTSIRLETYSCLQDARKLYRRIGFSLYKTNVGIERYGQVFDQEFWEKEL